MLRCFALCAALSFTFVSLGFAEGPVLAGEPQIATVRTFQGPVTPRINRVVPAPDVTIAVLADTVTPQEVPLLRRAAVAFLTPVLLAKRPVRLILASQASIDVSPQLSKASELQAVLKRITSSPKNTPSPMRTVNGLAELAATLPSNWAQTVIIGHLPQVGPDDTWASAWIGEIFRKRKVRVSFWSLHESAPFWAWNASASTLGTVTTASPTLSLNSGASASSSLFEVQWDTKISGGALVYPADLKLANGDSVLTVQVMSLAPGFALPLREYLGERAAMAASGMDNEAVAQAVLALNPVDPEALHRIAAIRTAQKRYKEAAQMWKKMAEIEPQNPDVWIFWGSASYAAGDFDSSEKELARAATLGAKSSELIDTRARLRIRQSDYAGGLHFADDALKRNRADQDAWLLRAECAQNLDQWSIQAESLEHAISLGPVPFAKRTELISLYLKHGAADQTIRHLNVALSDLPHDAPVLAQYAEFWEQAGDPKRAEGLWNTALALDPKCEPAVVGLASHLIREGRAADALQLTEQGLESVPGSTRTSLLKAEALESLHRFYAARRTLSSSKSPDVELLKVRARLEDWYGSDSWNSYGSLVQALVQQHATLSEITTARRRGLEVSLRSGRVEDARAFADQLAAVGDKSGLEMLRPKALGKPECAQLVGGVDALGFLVNGQTKSRPEDFLLEYSRILNAFGKTDFQAVAAKVHDYFQQVAALAALGTAKSDHFELLLSLHDKSSRHRTELALKILDLKLDPGKQALTVRSLEKKSQARRQEGLAALAIDVEGIQESLAAGKPYTLEIPIDRIPVFPSEETWKKAFFEHQQYTGGFAEALVTDPRLPQLYYALNSMDREAADVLVRSIPLRTLAESYSGPLSLFSAALAIKDKRVELPGGKTAQAVWLHLVSADPSDPAAFFRALLKADGGRLFAFFYTLSQLDRAHQRFFTHSTERTKRFYEYFRESREMRRGVDHPLGTDTFSEFLREVPLDEDGSVNFPGGPELWMVAKGEKHSTASVAKLNKKVKRTAAPKDEDKILLRLAGTEYKATASRASELANFIAVVHLDRERKVPMSEETALLLAQNYPTYRELYPYFAGLGDLDAADYESIFHLVDQLGPLDPVTANIRMAQVHSWLAMLTIIGRSGAANQETVRHLLKDGIERYLRAKDAWTAASLNSLGDLTSLCADHSSSRDSKLRIMLLGSPSQVSFASPTREVRIDPIGRRHKTFKQVLRLQNVPSLDVIFAIRDALVNVRQTRRTDVIEANLAKLGSLRSPKERKLPGAEHKELDRYEIAGLQKHVARLAQLVRKQNPNPTEIDEVSARITADLEPWTALAMAGQIYAWYLDPTDLIVSDDPALLRKHRFVELAPIGKRSLLMQSGFVPKSDGEGSYFVGGFAGFSLLAGQARILGNHLCAPVGEVFAAAIVASVRATDWRPFSESALQAFGAKVRIAREWIVQSSVSVSARHELEEQTVGLLSLTRRKMLMEAIAARDWTAVWESVSLGDLYFLGDGLLEHVSDDLWRSPALRAMKQAVSETDALDILGPVAPELDGCTAPHLRRYPPYEQYEHYAIPTRIAQRAAELKLYLAWQADSAAWPPEAMASVAPIAADAVVKKIVALDSHDWNGVIKAYKTLRSDVLDEFLTVP